MSQKFIKLEQFEGPLFLLLQVIEQQKMDITEVSLAKVTDQYIAILEQQENILPDDLADFLIVAAKLLYIKSKVFSPDYFTTEYIEEESELERQLKMYKEYVELSKNISKFWKSEKEFFSREKPYRLPPKKFIPPKNLTLKDLPGIMQYILSDIEPIAKLKLKKIKTVVSIKERINMIKQIIKQKRDFDFYSLLKGTENKTDKIISFLAVLELVKQREVIVMQEEIFSNFTIRKI